MDRALVDFLTRGQNLLQFSFFLGWVLGIWNQGGKLMSRSSDEIH
jgi:hypothetical protein